MKQKTSKNEEIFYCCKKCDYTCNNKYNLKRHFSTTKHIMKQNETQNEEKTSETIFSCKDCDKNFKSRTSLWRHKKKTCLLKNKSEESLVKITDSQNNNNLINTLIQQLAEVQTKNQVITNELVRQNQKILEHIVKTPTNITNTNCNNKMTINMYLNKECKDAMNLADFVDKVQVSLDDLKYTAEYGYVKGISNIFAKQLQDMKPTERPIHCSDKKRMQFYIKEEDKWEKDTKHSKIDKSIGEVMLKQIKKIRHWEDDNPNFMHDEKLRNTWNKMIQQTLGGASDDEMKKNKMDIKKEVSKIIEVKNAMKD
jgi:uncharacterized protein YneR